MPSQKRKCRTKEKGGGWRDRRGDGRKSAWTVQWWAGGVGWGGLGRRGQGLCLLSLLFLLCWLTISLLLALPVQRLAPTALLLCLPLEKGRQGGRGEPLCLSAPPSVCSCTTNTCLPACSLLLLFSFFFCLLFHASRLNLLSAFACKL